MTNLSTQTVSTLISDPELGQMIQGSIRIEDSLASIVTVLGNRMEVDVCSIYLTEHDRRSIVLVATVGLNKSCIGKLRMGLNEGLAGLVAEQRQPVAVEEAAKHPRFKYFPEAEEDAYESFLGVPIQNVGALVVQTFEPRPYSPNDISGLSNTANRLGRCVSRFRQLRIQ